jgi:hypothetical protein
MGWDQFTGWDGPTILVGSTMTDSLIIFMVSLMYDTRSEATVAIATDHAMHILEMCSFSKSAI